MRLLFSLTLALGLVACGSPSGPEAPYTVFMNNLNDLCGQAFPGTVLEAPENDTTFVNKELVMHVRYCSPDSLRIPFHVGEDRSRTWVLSLIRDGVRLKHDHRKPDGSEDPVTQYGGDTRTLGMGIRQEFFADEYTASLIPAAATNVWTVEITPGETFVYALRREGTDRRFRISFDLKNPIPIPPAPWGFEHD